MMCIKFHCEVHQIIARSIRYIRLQSGRLLTSCRLHHHIHKQLMSISYYSTRGHLFAENAIGWWVGGVVLAGKLKHKIVNNMHSPEKENSVDRGEAVDV